MLNLTRTARRRGFTLVEIMIVVSIIALLATMALPALAKARRESRVSKMTNDLRVIWDAFQMYAMENGKFPVGWGSVPQPVTEYLTNSKWNLPTAMGGRWLYYAAFGTYLLVVDDFNLDSGKNPLAPSVDWMKVDGKIDDGNLATGCFRLVSGIQMQYSLDEKRW